MPKWLVIERPFKDVEAQQSNAHDKSAVEIHLYGENAKPPDQPRTMAAAIQLKHPEAAGSEEERVDLRSND